jgi:hypothetical protein
VLIDDIPDLEVLLALAPEELSPMLLRRAAAVRQNGMFSTETVAGAHVLCPGSMPGSSGYPLGRREEIDPHSHRTVTITDPREAQEMVILASPLLRIVASRRPGNKTAAPAA